MKTFTTPKNTTGRALALIVVLATALVLGLAGTALAVTGSVTWNGTNGASNNCEEGGRLHWVLTPGGNAVISSGTLTVTFEGGGSQTVTGQFQGGDMGAMHFYTEGDSQVATAVANYEYTGTQAMPVLTISDSVCNTTTTTGGTTTTSSTTSTTTGGTTSSTAGGTTSTSVAGTTSSTSGGTTSSTMGGVTSTTGGGVTTSSAVGGVSSTNAPSTVDRVDTGGGGTAGPSAAQWALLTLAVALGLGLVYSAASRRQKAK